MLVQLKHFTYDLKPTQRFWLKELRRHKGLWEPANVSTIRRLIGKGALAVDVGAHFGATSMAYSRFCKRVIAFEPNPETYRQALQHFALNQITNVKLYNLAIGDKPRKMSLASSRHPQSNDGMQRLTRMHDGLPTVKVRTLDSFRLKPDFIKIDVEGFEQLVLKGATETIKRFRPALLVETTWFKNVASEMAANGDVEDYRVDDYEIVKFLKELGYCAFRPGAPLVLLKTKKDFETCRGLDTLFLPK